MNIDEALELLSEDVLGDLKRKLKGQVSLSDNIRRVAKTDLQTALNFAEVIEDLANKKGRTEEGKDRDMLGVLNASRRSVRELKKALKTIDRIK